MKDWITVALAALAVFTVGVAAGAVLVQVVGPEPGFVSDTNPPVTVTATVRASERASRSHSRGVKPAPLPTSRTTSEGARGGLPAGPPRVSVYQAYAKARVSAREWPCLRELVQRESSWNPTNVTGSHYGLFQMRGLKHSTGWQKQIERGLAYIDHRYGGDVCVALSHSDRNGWY